MTFLGGFLFGLGFLTALVLAAVGWFGLALRAERKRDTAFFREEAR